MRESPITVPHGSTDRRHYLPSHLDRPRAALAALSGMLDLDGMLVLEPTTCLSIVEGCQFDAIRHGHRT